MSVKVDNMRIAHFTNFYKPSISGVVTSIVNFRHGLLEAGQEMHILAPRYHDYHDQEAYIFRFPAINLSETVNVSLAIPVRALIEPTMMGLKPDVIHSHHPILMGDMASAFAERLDIPLVFTFHTRYEQYIQEYISIAPELSMKLAETLVRRYLEKCDHVIAPTRSIQDFVQSYQVDVPVTIVPTPIDLKKYQELQPERVRRDLNLGDEIILLYLGRLSPEKNVGFLLRAFAKFRKGCENSLLVIVGGGPDGEHLKDLAFRLGIKPAVVFTGPVPQDEVPHYMAAADLFVFPSMTETQGLVLIEAMAAGTPVVAVDTAVNAEVLEGGGGLIVDQDEDDFVRGIRSIISSPSIREIMGTKAIATAAKYRISSAVDQLLGVYKSVVGDRP